MRALFLFLLVGCGGGSDPEETDPDTDPGVEPTLCEAGCVDTFAAACPNGPANEAECTTTCEGLRVGGCGTEYEAVLTCSDGEAVTCDVDGRPTVEACAAELSAFTSCLNAG